MAWFVKLILKMIFSYLFKDFGKKKKPISKGMKLKSSSGKKRKKKKFSRKKFICSSRRKQKRIYKLLTRGPAYFEIIVNVVFGLVVFVMFWKKAKNPKFLENFGETKL